MHKAVPFCWMTGKYQLSGLGKLPLNGLTSREAENLITERLKSYVKERPTVVVRMSGFKVSVLGEVASPGVYPVVNEQINVLEALAMAGDLTIYGVRDNVKLIREDKNGHKQFCYTQSERRGFVIISLLSVATE